MSSTLDGLLNDLELACQERAPAQVAPSSHLETVTSEPLKSVEDVNVVCNQAKAEGNRFSPVKTSSPPPVPQRDLSSVMATTTMSHSSGRVANNLNELDVLLQDLSNARLSNGVGSSMQEQRSESVMTSSAVSYQSSGFYPSDHNRGSAERKSPILQSSGVVRTPMEDAMIREMSSKMHQGLFTYDQLG